jgi:hypothetical protein
MRIGDKVWLASRDVTPNATKSTYQKPTQITLRPNYFTVMPATSRGYLAIIEFGEKVNKTWIAVANPSFTGKIKEGDVMWVDGHTPNEALEAKYGYGSSANAQVLAVNIGNRCLNITLGENVKQVKK